MTAVTVWGRLGWPRESALYYTACVILIVIAATLRFYNLPSASLWQDEAVAANNATGSITDVIENTRHNNSSPLLWPLGLWVIQKIEKSSLSVRIVPATASVLTVAAILLLLPRAGLRRSSALIAGTLMTVSTGAIFEAQQVREYSIDTLLVVVMIAGAMLYLNGQRWMLLTSLVLAPLLQYGIVLFGVVLIVALIIKRGSEFKKKGMEKAIQNFLQFSVWPVLALGAGSLATWFMTLRYQGGSGWGQDQYLSLFYYSGDLTDISAVLQFLYHGIIDLIEYHIEQIPIVIIAVIIVISLAWSREYRNSLSILVLVGSILMALIAVVFSWYPLGDIRQLLFWGPGIVVGFACAITAIADQVGHTISRIHHTPLKHVRFFSRTSIKVAPVAAMILSIIVTGIGISRVVNSSILYSDPVNVGPVLEYLDQARDDGDLVLWTDSLLETVTFYDPDLSPSYRWCGWMNDCLDTLLSFPDELAELDGKLWLVIHPLKDLPDSKTYLRDFQIATRVMTPSNIEVIIDDVTSLYLLAIDPINSIEKYENIDTNFANSLQRFGDPVAMRESYTIYLDDSLILYVSNRCEDDRRFFIHFYPNEVDFLDDDSLGFNHANPFNFSDTATLAGDYCFVVQSLPMYSIRSMVTGQFDDSGEYWRSRIDLGKLLYSGNISDTSLADLPDAVVENDIFRIHIADRSVIYITQDCAAPSVSSPFFLHVSPVDVGDLPLESREHGFLNLDFLIVEEGRDVGDSCVVVRVLPEYPIARVELGQYNADGRIWEHVIEWEEDGSPAE